MFLSSGQMIFRRFVRRSCRRSAFLYKRLAGLPGDQLRIDSPFLYINGKKAAGLRLRTGDVGATAVPRLCAWPRVFGET